MAKESQAEEIIEVAPQKKTKAKKEEPKKAQWEIKDRHYYLIGKQPLTFTIPSRHSRKRSLLWFDPEKNEQRELRYATNQNSPLKDEQKGEVTLGLIMF